MAALTVVTPTTAGVTHSTASAAGGGDTFENTGSELFFITNGGGSPITVTFDAGSYGGEAITDRAVVVSNGVTKMIGPFRPDIFTGTVSITYSGVTSVVVAVYRTRLT